MTAFPTEIWSGDNIDSICGINICVVWDEFCVHEEELLQRVAPIQDLDTVFNSRNNRGPNVVIVDSTVGKR